MIKGIEKHSLLYEIIMLCRRLNSWLYILTTTLWGNEFKWKLRVPNILECNNTTFIKWLIWCEETKISMRKCHNPRRYGINWTKSCAIQDHIILSTRTFVGDSNTHSGFSYIITGFFLHHNSCLSLTYRNITQRAVTITWYHDVWKS